VSVAACADLLRRGDPERWRAAMAAPPTVRPGLMALYAFNLEIARAPWVASEEMLAEIRLRWWTDTVAEIYAGATPRRHEVAEPLAEAIRGADLPQRLFEETIAARLFDARAEPHPDLDALRDHVDRTAGHLMELAARHLGAPEAAVAVVREFARGAGLAALLRARPELAARNRDPMPPGADAAALAREGRAAIARARARRGAVPRAVVPALLPGWLADVRLAQAARGEDMEVSEFQARGRLLWTAMTGRW